MVIGGWYNGEQFIKEGTTLIETRLDHTVLTATTPQSLAEKLLECETYDYFEKLLELDDSDLAWMFRHRHDNDNRFEESLMLLAERRGREADALVKKLDTRENAKQLYIPSTAVACFCKSFLFCHLCRIFEPRQRS